MSEFVPFHSRAYGICLVLLLISRCMDFLSTWVATPNLVLEGNPIARKLGWRWGIPLNVAMCFALAFWPMSAIAVTTMSLLVAARNFQHAWLMRSMGEEAYRDWYIARMQETRITLYLSCLAGNTLLTAAVGVALIYLSGDWLVPVAIGVGMVAYSLAVAFYTLLAVWRLRGRTAREIRALESALRPRAGHDSGNGAPARSAPREEIRAEDVR